MNESLASQLDELQHELEKAGYWQSVPPSAEKMMSTLPFSVDTLSFLEWLQWVYIARLRALIEAKAALPKGAQVFPYAEEALKEQIKPLKTVLLIISRIDRMLAA